MAGQNDFAYLKRKKPIRQDGLFAFLRLRKNYIRQ